MSIKVKLFAIAKDEAVYLSTWIHHHLFFGFDEIEVWINNTSDNSEDIIKKISSKNPCIKYTIADEFLEDCKLNNKLFQVEAYKFVFNSSKELGFDYLMFLDIDEYFIPSNFTSSVKDLIERQNEFDSLSLQWYFEAPNVNKPTFSQDISQTISICQNQHVKSILNLRKVPSFISIHNSNFPQGTYVLYDGSIFSESDCKIQFNRSKVSFEYFSKNKGVINDYFIYHSAFRSQLEYAVSLMRGRSHVNDDSSFKVNREGFVQESLSHKPLIFKINDFDYISYLRSYYDFIISNKIIDLIDEAREHLLNRYFRLISMDYCKFEENKGIFKGLTLDFFKKLNARFGVRFHIDRLIYSNEQLTLNGWCIDGYSDIPKSIKIVVDENIVSPKRMIFIKRLDVVQKIDKNAKISCGFHCYYDLEDIFLPEKIQIKFIFEDYEHLATIPVVIEDS